LYEVMSPCDRGVRPAREIAPSCRLNLPDARTTLPRIQLWKPRNCALVRRAGSILRPRASMAIPRRDPRVARIGLSEERRNANCVADRGLCTVHGEVDLARIGSFSSSLMKRCFADEARLTSVRLSPVVATMVFGRLRMRATSFAHRASALRALMNWRR
jgi:hypothetical protein